MLVPILGTRGSVLPILGITAVLSRPFVGIAGVFVPILGTHGSVLPTFRRDHG